MRRTQIYLVEGQDATLEARARAAGTTKSALIREAIDAYLTHGGPSEASELARMRSALAAAAGVAADLPEGAAYVDDLRAGDGRRAARLDARRRA